MFTYDVSPGLQVIGAASVPLLAMTASAVMTTQHVAIGVAIALPLSKQSGEEEGENERNLR